MEYKYKTQKEIFSQFNALQKTYEYFDKKKSYIKEFFDKISFSSITFIGSGSSYTLCESASLSTKINLNINSHSIVAGDLMLNFDHYENYLRGTLLIAPSRSGSTSEVINAVKKAKRKYDVPFISISAKENSKLSQISDLDIVLPWAFDESVCQTRTVSNLYIANLLLIDLMSSNSELKEDIKKVIDYGDKYLMNNKSIFEKISSNYDWDKVFILADSELQGIGKEAALAFKEISRSEAYYHHLLDVRHGPMVLIDKNTLILFANSPNGYKHQKDLIGDLKENGALVVTNGTHEEHFNSDIHIEFPEVQYSVRGLFFIIVNQAISYYKAINNNINPDEPEGLEPWISLN